MSFCRRYQYTVLPLSECLREVFLIIHKLTSCCSAFVNPPVSLYKAVDRMYHEIKGYHITEHGSNTEV